MDERKIMLTTLIEGGLDIDVQCGRKKTALHLASQLNDDAIVKLLVERGANINLTDGFKRNALHFALKNSKVNMGIVKHLIDKGIDAEARDDNGRTPLYFCCIGGHYDALVMLLDLDVNVKVITDEKINLLHAILRQRKPNKEMIRLLINRGADVNGEDSRGRTPLHYVCYHDYHLFEAPVTDNYEESILHHMILSGANVNIKDSQNRSALYYAVYKGNYNCIKMLLDHDADINAVFDSGKTVLHVAFEKELSPDIEVIKLLLDRGVDANKRDKNQTTALEHAVTRPGSDDLVKILFNARAHDQLMSTDYVTFLHYAVYHGNCFAVELFLESGLDLDKIDVNNAEYPLKFAVRNQQLCSNLLLKMTEFIRDCKKKANFGRNRIVQLLEEYFPNCSDRVPVPDDDHLDSDLEQTQTSNNVWSLGLNDYLCFSSDDSESEWEYLPEEGPNYG
jgi:ankyrin repeat protein